MSREARQSILSVLGHPAILAALLASVNLYVCRELFVTEYLRYMDSIEGAYVGLARWILHHPGERQWFPLWYGGIPFQNTYPPLLHQLAAAFAGIAGVSPALAHHAVSAAMYCLGPVTLFWLALRLTGNRLASFLACTAYSVLSFSALLVPEVARDMGTAFGARRLHALVRYGEGPHIASMTLLPVALVTLHWALEKRSPLRVLAAALALVAVVLTNWLGAFALAAGVLALLAAIPHGFRPRTLAFASLIGVFAYAIASPWIPPSTIAAISRNAQFTVGQYQLGATQAICGAALLLLGMLLAWALRRKGCAPAEYFALFWLLLMAAITLPSYWTGIYLIPQPQRYHLELEMAIALAACVAVTRLRVGHQRAVAAACLVLAFFPLREQRQFARHLIAPVEIERTIQYQIARWLDENLPGRRIFVTGTTRFWLTAFSDNPMLGGGFDQGITNPVVPIVNFGIPFVQGDDEESARWLRVWGIDAVFVSGPNGREVLQDFQDRRKYRGVLSEIYRDGDDVIYRVPRRTASLAHVIPREAVVSRAPVNVLDIEPIAAFSAALEDQAIAPATFEWRNPHSAAITAAVTAGQVVVVQINQDPGWRAEIGGRPQHVFEDALGFLVIEPDSAGTCAITLTYDGGTEMLLTRIACAAAFLVLLTWLLLQVWRRHSARAPTSG